MTPASRPASSRLASRLGWLGAASAAAALAWSLFRVFLAVPNDHRIEFSFPDLPRVTARETVSHDFVRRAGEGGYVAPGAAAAAAAETVTAALGNEYVVARPALRALEGGRIDFKLVVPPNASLRFACGLRGSAQVRFIVEAARPGEAAQVLFSEIVAGPAKPRAFRRFRAALRVPDSFEDPWREATVDLARWGGELRLTFRTEPAEVRRRKEASEPEEVFWGAPQIVTLAQAPAPDRNLLLIVADPIRSDALRAHGAKPDLLRAFDRLAHEGVDMQRAYSNSVDVPGGFESLLRPGPASASAPAPSLIEALRNAGYRTVLLTNEATPPEPFDEAVRFPADGYEPVRVLRDAVGRIAADRGAAPLCLVLRLTVDGSHPPPFRFRFHALAYALKNGGMPDRWRYASALAFLDSYLDRLFDVFDAAEAWDRWLVAAVSTRGLDFHAPGGEESLREPAIRTVWLMRHRDLPQGRAIAEPVQLSNVPPTVLKVLRVPGAESFGSPGFGVARGELIVPEPPSRIITRSGTGKSLTQDGHYKLIRVSRPGDARLREELYDLWVDAGETDDLARHNRALLASLRRALAETDPDPVETRLLFWDLRGKTVKGMVESAAGDFQSFSTSGVSTRRLPTVFDFEIAESSGEVRFSLWPPGASFILRVRLGEQYFGSERIRVSRFGLPLFEHTGIEWYDYNSFPWSEGLARPLRDDRGPLLYMGRVFAPRREPSP